MITAIIDVVHPLKMSDVGDDKVCARMATITLTVMVYGEPDRRCIHGPIDGVLQAIKDYVYPRLVAPEKP